MRRDGAEASVPALPPVSSPRTSAAATSEMRSNKPRASFITPRAHGGGNGPAAAPPPKDEAPPPPAGSRRLRLHAFGSLISASSLAEASSRSVRSHSRIAPGRVVAPLAEIASRAPVWPRWRRTGKLRRDTRRRRRRASSRSVHSALAPRRAQKRCERLAPGQPEATGAKAGWIPPGRASAPASEPRNEQRPTRACPACWSRAYPRSGSGSGGGGDQKGHREPTETARHHRRHPRHCLHHGRPRCPRYPRPTRRTAGGERRTWLGPPLSVLPAPGACGTAGQPSALSAVARRSRHGGRSGGSTDRRREPTSCASANATCRSSAASTSAHMSTQAPPLVASIPLAAAPAPAAASTTTRRSKSRRCSAASRPAASPSAAALLTLRASSSASASVERTTSAWRSRLRERSGPEKIVLSRSLTSRCTARDSSKLAARADSSASCMCAAPASRAAASNSSGAASSAAVTSASRAAQRRRDSGSSVRVRDNDSNVSRNDRFMRDGSRLREQAPADASCEQL
eukprot:scaffold5762_cov101-Isochrysis_galbana.AAC.2